jgi:hypothetical protein
MVSIRHAATFEHRSADDYPIDSESRRTPRILAANSPWNAQNFRALITLGLQEAGY